jgi:transcriptional regulator with XRE-family HTH domain
MKPPDLQTDEELEVDLGFRLRKIRLGKNWTQEKVADLAGISAKTLKNLEAGRGSTVTTLVKVLQALGNACAIEYLAPIPTVSPLALLRRRDKLKEQIRASRPVRSKKSIMKRQKESEEEFELLLEDV